MKCRFNPNAAIVPDQSAYLQDLGGILPLPMLTACLLATHGMAGRAQASNDSDSNTIGHVTENRRSYLQEETEKCTQAD